jgi:hypothetical protein
MSYLEYPQIPRDQIKLKWHCDYHDGPLSGICEYQKKRYWFALCDEFRNYPELTEECLANSKDEDWYRRYTLHELSSEELQDEEHWHQLFQEHVGHHTDYDENEKCDYRAVKPQSEWNKYYSLEKERKRPDYSKNKIIGWYQC